MAPRVQRQYKHSFREFGRRGFLRGVNGREDFRFSVRIVLGSEQFVDGPRKWRTVSFENFCRLQDPPDHKSSCDAQASQFANLSPDLLVEGNQIRLEQRRR